MVLIAAWMFILGVLVGRGTAPVTFDIQKLGRELEGLIAADVKKLLEPVAVETGDKKTESELEFYEELKKSEPAAPDPSSRSVPSQPQASPPPAQISGTKEETPTGKKEAPPKAIAKKSENGAIVQTGRAAHGQGKAAVDRPLDGSSYVTIQAASLKDLNEADALVKKLKDRGYPAYKIIAVVPEKGIWFRIRVGRYGSREAAGDVVRRLKKDGYRPILVETQ